MSTSYPYAFGVDNPSIDEFKQKQYPAIILNGTEAGGVTSEIVEAGGGTWIVNNALWNANFNGFVQQNPALMSSAFVTTPSGSVTLYTAPANAPTPLVWSSGTSLLGQIANPYNVLFYGLKGDGVTNDGPALNALLASIPPNSVVQFPPAPGGQYIINTQIKLVSPVTLKGFGGRYSAEIYGSVAGSMFFNSSVYGFKFEGMTITNLTGSCFAAYGTNSIVSGVVRTDFGNVGDGSFEEMSFFCTGHDAVLLDNFNFALFSKCYFNVTHGGTASGIHLTGTGVATGTGKPSNGMQFGFTAEIHISDCLINCTGSASDSTSAGLRIDAFVDGVYMDNCDLNAWANSILIAPNTRTATYQDTGAVNTYTFNGFALNLYFTNCTPSATQQSNVVIQPSDGTSAVNNVLFSNCAIVGANTNGNAVGVLLDGLSGTGAVNNIQFVNCGVGQNSLHGYQIRASQNVTVIGGWIASNSLVNTIGGYAVVLDASASVNVLFSGVNMSYPYNASFPVGFPSSGIYVGAYSHQQIRFRDCNLTGTPVTALVSVLPLAAQRTGELEIRECYGINPIGSGSWLSGLSSGVAGYNIAPSEISVFVAGGTVSAISVNGQLTGLTSGAFRIQPGGYITVTYSAAPTITEYAY